MSSAALKAKRLEAASPWVLLVATLLLAVLILWQLIVMLFRIPDFIFPSPTDRKSVV